jgi:hypothetical protein
MILEEAWVRTEEYGRIRMGSDYACIDDDGVLRWEDTGMPVSYVNHIRRNVNWEPILIPKPEKRKRGKG